MILSLHKKVCSTHCIYKACWICQLLVTLYMCQSICKSETLQFKAQQNKASWLCFFFFVLVLVCVCKDLFCVIHSSDSALNNSPSSRFGNSTIRDYSSPVKINESHSQRRMKPPPESYPSWQTADLGASLVSSFSMYLALLLLPVLLGC